MKFNSHLPKIKIDPETSEVMVDGQHAYVPPADKLPLTQGFHLF